MSEPRQAPPGVETTPTGPHVSLQEAAARLGKDPRTVVRAIKSGELHGGAIPRPERLKWYVYVDALPAPPAAPSPTQPSSSEIDDLRAQLVTQLEVNRLLIAAQQNMLAGESAAERYRAAAQNYLDALSQFVTPGHLGQLADQL